MSRLGWSELELEAGQLVTALIAVRSSFARMSLSSYELCALKIIILTDDSMTSSIHAKYLNVFKCLCQSKQRQQQLLMIIQNELLHASQLLLHSKLFYLPFLLFQ